MAYESPTVDSVRLIISTPLSDAAVAAAVTDAELLVGACIEGLEDDRAAAIVKYVAADLITSVVSTGGAGALTSRSLGDATDTWASQGAEFGKSAYWSRALMLDPNGCLAKLGKRRPTFERV